MADAAQPGAAQPGAAQAEVAQPGAAQPGTEASADSAGEERRPADQRQRTRTRNERSVNLFVEAGAGTGKTRALVDRVEALVLEDGVAMENIATITFTDKAGAELRDRIRERFERSADPLAVAATQQLDGAAVGTLHSFAQRILAEHPVEARLPPGIEVLDDIASQVEFEHQWRKFLNKLLEDQSVAKSLLCLEVVGVKIDHLRSLTMQMSDNWDLIEQRLELDPPQPPALKIERLLREFDKVLKLQRFCTDKTDRLLDCFEEIAEHRSRLQGAFDYVEALALTKSASETKKPGNLGRKANWDIEVADVRHSITGLHEDCARAVGEVTTAALSYVGARLGRFVLESAEARRKSGRLQFHDLLVRTRQLLRSRSRGAEVRAALRRKYTHLLLDEFQDTDPIQIEIAVLIATTADQVGDVSWNDLEVEPGRLFFVGDPKQSIYRFRRADIGLYLTARERFADHASLTVNFRTVEPIIDWINSVFSELIQPTEGSQPEYLPLSAHRQGHDSEGPAVALLGAEPIPRSLNAEQLRAVESADVATAVAEILADGKGWCVEDPDGQWRQARPGDVCILLPTRNSLPSLERALEEAGVAYRAETSSLVYTTREVRELMLTLRAVSDPTDELATVAALRSFVYGCGDDDLASWRLEHGGRFRLHHRRIDEHSGHPVADALSHLGKLHSERRWLTPAGLLERVIRERAVLESTVATGAPRDVWRRLRFVVDQARAWSDAGGTDLRAYLEWARRQGVDNARVSETVLPETDDDSVRIMTVHGAKGLEFPITVLAGMTTRFVNPQRGPAIAFPPGEQAVLKVSTKVASERYAEWQPLSDTMDRHERLRLLYVAATRARDHLIVCLHRPGEGRTHETSATVLAQHASNRWAASFEPSGGSLKPATPPSRSEMLAKEQWSARRDEATAAATRRTVVSATTLANEVEVVSDPGLNKAARNLDLPPWLKGRFGSAFGRAVHGVLQVVDLSSRAGLLEATRIHASAEGVANRRAMVERVARQALGTRVAQQASATEHWREVWVAAMVGDCLVEGYIDLLYREGPGLVVVDWKTDRVDNEDDIAAKLDRYRLQGAGYVAALEAATALTVERMVFVFLSEDGAIERELPGLRSAVDEVQQRTHELAELSGLNTQHPDL